MYFSAVLLGGGPLAGILYSYFKIVSSIQAIPSALGKYKAFSTCASHLSVVSLFYGAGLGVYLSSAGTHSSQSIATASVMYTVVAPMLNPFTYSLRNRDIKRALKRFFGMQVQRAQSPWVWKSDLALLAPRLNTRNYGFLIKLWVLNLLLLFLSWNFLSSFQLLYTVQVTILLSFLLCLLSR